MGPMRGSTERRRKGWRKTRSKLIVCTWIALLLYINFLLDSLYLSPGLDDPDLNGMALAVQHKQQQQQQRPKPRGPVAAVVPSSVGFVHIGKTAGSTLSKLLRNGCHSFVPKPCRVVPNETVVSELVESYYHVPDFWRLPASRHGSYVLSVRDAYERTVSALLYNHPENVAHYLSVHNLSESVKEVQSRSTAYRCFPTLDAFAMLLERGNTTDCDYPRDHSVVDAGNCSELACAAIHHRVRFYRHLFFDYRNIYSKLPKDPPRKWYAIRQESLWHDWSGVNAAFGRPPATDQGGPGGQLTDERGTGGMDLPVTRDISGEGRRKLCLALEGEYAAYFRILKAAENLGPGDREESRRIAVRNCPGVESLRTFSFE